MSPDDQRLWATLTHLAGLVFQIVGVLVLYLTLKDRGPYIRSQAAEALNFWITVYIAGMVSFALIFVLVGFLLLAALGVAAIVLPIIAAIAANRGEDYRYPATLRLVH